MWAFPKFIPHEKNGTDWIEGIKGVNVKILTWERRGNGMKRNVTKNLSFFSEKMMRISIEFERIDLLFIRCSFSLAFNLFSSSIFVWFRTYPNRRKGIGRKYQKYRLYLIYLFPRYFPWNIFLFFVRYSLGMVGNGAANGIPIRIRFCLINIYWYSIVFIRQNKKWTIPNKRPEQWMNYV